MPKKILEEGEEEEEEKEIMLELEDGKELPLKDLVRDEIQEALKDSDILNENGNLSYDQLPSEAKQEVDDEEEEMENASKFVKTQIAKGTQHEKDLDYDTKALDTTSGSFGVSVPTALADTVITTAEKVSVLRDRASVVRVDGDFEQPTEGTAVTAYWVGENTSITESNPTLNSHTLSDNWLAARVKVSFRLLYAPDMAVVNYVGDLAGRAIGSKEETALIDGSGSGKPEGIRTSGAGTTISQSGASLAYSDLKTLYRKLDPEYRQNGVFVTSKAGATLIDSLTDSNDRPLFRPNEPMDELFNIPLLESEDIPADLGTGSDETEIWFMDPNYYQLKRGQDLQMAADDIISNLQRELVFYEAVDGVMAQSEAFVKMDSVV